MASRELRWRSKCSAVGGSHRNAKMGRLPAKRSWGPHPNGREKGALGTDGLWRVGRASRGLEDSQGTNPGLENERHYGCKATGLVAVRRKMKTTGE